MARGGARIGAGRKPGQKSAKTLERESLSLKALKEGITPLEVMLRAMRAAVERDDWREAATHAKDAAPYIHPKLSSMDMNASVSGSIDMPTEITIKFVDGNK